jgi:hypothetical protein
LAVTAQNHVETAVAGAVGPCYKVADEAAFMRRRPRPLALALVFVAVLVAGGCTSPTLPLPPPALPTITAGSEPNTFRLRSDKGALPNALIVSVNRNETLPREDRVRGTIADPQGSWELVVKAHVGDTVDISQEDGSIRSPTTTVELR